MSKTTYFYKPWGGVCAADTHRGSYLPEREKEVVEHHGSFAVCERCRSLFQPEGWHEFVKESEE